MNIMKHYLIGLSIVIGFNIAIVITLINVLY